MKINHAQFVISAVDKDQYPKDSLPEIALAGRSNVGKSSFINRMIQRRGLAKTSSTPGKTQTLNFYKINHQFYFVDVPGYGYARVSKRERDRWGFMMEEYFETREPLKAVILLTDLRHPPTNDDLQMFDYLTYYQLPVLIVATKFDKVKRKDQKNFIQRVEDTFGVIEGENLIPFSAQTGVGRDKSWKALKNFL